MNDVSAVNLSAPGGGIPGPEEQNHNFRFNRILEDAYDVMAELWCSPMDVDYPEIKKAARETVGQMSTAGEIPAGKSKANLPEVSELLNKFLTGTAISEEEYIDLFELEPKCPLYLGSHSFEEPKTCAGAGVSDRNGYMIELVGIYRHFGQTIGGNELPDYLPLMIDFLSLTCGSRHDPVREKFIKEYMLPFFPPMRKRLDELKSPYAHLLNALEKIINCDLDEQTKLKEGAYVE